MQRMLEIRLSEALDKNKSNAKKNTTTNTRLINDQSVISYHSLNKVSCSPFKIINAMFALNMFPLKHVLIEMHKCYMLLIRTQKKMPEAESAWNILTLYSNINSF